MTLTLDEVQNTKFHMARRSGYEVTDVDLFVDRVETTFAQLTEENESLKAEIEALKSAQGDGAAPAAADRPDQQPEGQNQPAEQPAEQAGKPAEHVQGTIGDGEERIVVSTAADASPAVVRLVQLATEQAEKLVAEARAEAERSTGEATSTSQRTVEDANRQAQEITTDARNRAERIESDARSTAERLRAEAQGESDNLKREVETRRANLFGQLETERDELTGAIDQLRSFETTYRTNLTTHLRQQLQLVESDGLEPGETPTLLQQRDSGQTDGEEQLGRRGQPQSDTPRLDALLRDQR